MKTINIIDAMSDPRLFAEAFERSPESWDAWRVFCKALFALPMTEAELEIFRAATGLEMPPLEQAREAWLCCGRGAGKSFMMAFLGVYLALSRDYKPFLQRGQRAYVYIIASDLEQAGNTLRYVHGLFETKGLRDLIQHKTDASGKRTLTGITSKGIALRNRVSIRVMAASTARVRGYSLAAVICDEIGHWKSEARSSAGADVDTEILRSVRPGLARIPGSILLAGSTPYNRKGALWEAVDTYHGDALQPLVWVASTQTMNPTFDVREIEREMLRDPANALAEYFAQFRTDLEILFSREIVSAAIGDVPVTEREPRAAHRYFAGVDPSGGAGDSMTMCICHREGERAVVDLVREARPSPGAPINLAACVADFAVDLKRYNVRTVRGDKYARHWVTERFNEAGITYEPADVSTSEAYMSLLSGMNSRRVDLVSSDRLTSQLLSLSRRNTGGKPIVEHPTRSHDDIASAVAQAVHQVLDRKSFKATVSPLRM